MLACALLLAAAPARARDAEIQVRLGGSNGTGGLPGGVTLGTFLGGELAHGVGAGFDLGGSWMHAPKLAVPATGTAPDGRPLSVTYEIPDASVDLYPLFAHLYLPLGRGPVTGMVGAGGGWNLLSLEGRDFTTQFLGGWGGCTWAGIWRTVYGESALVGVGVVGQLRAGTVERRAWDPALGARVRQRIDTAGWSLAVSIRMGFSRQAPSR